MDSSSPNAFFVPQVKQGPKNNSKHSATDAATCGPTLKMARLAILIEKEGKRGKETEGKRKRQREREREREREGGKECGQ